MTGLVGTLLVHGALVAAVLLAPVLGTREVEPLEFVAVQIVPVQALGVPEPAPPPPPAPRPEPLPAPDAKPPAPREAEPAPEPQPRRQAPTPSDAERAERDRGRQDAGQRQGSPFGSPAGTSPFGAQVGLDSPEFVYGYYVEQMLAMIGSHWLRPPVGPEVEAVIFFRIGRDGRISDLELIEPSGYRSFDLAGQRAVSRASPLPPLPKSFKPDSLGVRLRIR